MRTASLDSYNSASSSVKEAIKFHLSAPEVMQFEACRRKEGLLQKKSSNFMVGWQERYFKIRCNKNFLLSYHKKEQKNGEPQGVLNIGNITKVSKNGDKKFSIIYGKDKTFDLKTRDKTERDSWVDALDFLMEIKDKIGNIGDDRSSSINSYFSTDSPVVENSSDKKKDNSKNSYRFENLGKDDLLGIMSEEDNKTGIISNTGDNKQSENILTSTGIRDYINNIPEKLLKSRVMYGFLNKPNRTRLKIEKKRWVFLISSRPLSQEAYLEDQEEITDDELPPLTEFDTLYYYKTGYNANEVVLAGQIDVLKMENVQVSSDQKQDSHSFIIDANGKKYEFISDKRYIIEQWVDAIELSAKTAKEKQYSITGKIKNISMIVTKFEIDRDQLSDELVKELNSKLCDDFSTDFMDFDEVYITLETLDPIREDLINTFDACLVQNPPRKDIIQLFMEKIHSRLCERLTHEWETKALLMTPLDIFSLCEWIHQYMTTLKKFGIKDESLRNGYLTLVNAYKRKIHMQIYPMITNVLIRERDSQVETSSKGELYTHSPGDIFKIFLEVFEVILKQPMKEVILGVLEVIHEVFSQYLRALYQMITMDRTLTFDYLVALCNNFGKFSDQIELLVEPLCQKKDLSREELEAAFDQRVIQKHFGKIISKIIERITEETWLEVGKFYTCSYIDLNLQTSLNKSFQTFDEKVDQMSKQTSREAWKGFMNRTVVSYVQVLFNSFSKIKKKKDFSAIDQIQKDYDLIEDMFSDYMTKRILRPSLEILGDIKNFFETTVDFLTISIGKMRKDHGPAFNLTTVKALLSLRTDLQKSEKNKVLALSKELLDEYRDEGLAHSTGIFNNVDIASAAQDFNEEMKDPSEGEGKDETSISQEDSEEEIDLDDFLKQGGIDIDDLDEKQVEEEMRKSRRRTKMKKKDKKKIVGREDMSGFLFKSTEDLSENKGLFDKVLNTVTDTIGMVADNIDKKRSKRYFRIKKGHLYWYIKEDSDKAQNDIDIKKIEQLELNQDNPKMIFIVIENRFYKLEHQNKEYIQEWYKSLCLVRSKSEEYLNLDRYVDAQVFEKLSGKSIFRDFEVMLKEHAKEVEDQKRREEEEAKRIRDAEIEEEVKREIEALKEKKYKVAAKKKEKEKDKINKQKEEEKKEEEKKKLIEEVSKDSVKNEDDDIEKDIRMLQVEEASAEGSIILPERREFQKSDTLVNQDENKITPELKLEKAPSAPVAKEPEDLKKKEEMLKVYQDYSSVKQDSMFDKIKKHEDESSKEETKKARVSEKKLKSTKSSTLKTATRKTDDSESSNYKGSDLNAPKYKNEKAVNERPVPQPNTGVCSCFFGLFKKYKKLPETEN